MEAVEKYLADQFIEKNSVKLKISEDTNGKVHHQTRVPKNSENKI